VLLGFEAPRPFRQSIRAAVPRPTLVLATLHAMLLRRSTKHAASSHFVAYLFWVISGTVGSSGTIL